MTYSDKEKTVQNITQMLNGLDYAEDQTILKEVHEKILYSLKVVLSPNEQQSLKQTLENTLAATITQLSQSGLAQDFSKDSEK